MPAPILRYFEYEHLTSETLREVSRKCADLAAEMDADLPDCEEKSAGLRSLLQAKDAFVRAALP